MTESTNTVDKLTVVVGAGDDYCCDLSNNSRHYQLIDAREEAVDALQNTYKDEARVSVKHALITNKAEPVQFYRYSLAEFSSTLKLDELSNVLPGLTLQSSESLTGMTLTEVLEPAPKAEAIELVINAPGQELALLQSLAAINKLLELDKLTVTASRNMLYKQGNTTTELVNWLEEQGFELTRENSQQFSLVIQSWSIDKKKLRISQLERELALEKEYSQKHFDQVHSLKKELEVIKKGNDKKSQQLQEQTYRNQMLEREIAKLEAQVELMTDVVFRGQES